MHPADFIKQRIYSGFLGKTIGVRLGAPVEPTQWTYERIRAIHGEITGYVRDYRNFAADDDTNGPVYFIRAMRDYQLQPSAQQVGKTWLNYAADGHGMFWWGGIGVSTEHTGYANLRAGIAAPLSGSIAQNGLAVAEQIGGQIFIDSWGWVNPGNPARAATMAATAASVAHDGEGLNGARFVAAMVAAAFDADSVEQLFAAGLDAISPDSGYARVVGAVLDFQRRTPDDWRACRDMLGARFGYDRYPGQCHIIPNAGALALAVAYGGGKLGRTVEIASMCGWDTDCNAGNAGAIIGTFQGVQPGWDAYRKPINDVVIASGVTGSVNIVDIPTFAAELTALALALDGRADEAAQIADLTNRGVHFDFALPGATHGFRTGGTNKIGCSYSAAETPSGPGALQVLIDRLPAGQVGRVFWKPFYRRADFDDERYSPMLSPIAASGQNVSLQIQLSPFDGNGPLRIAPFVRHAISGQIERAADWSVPTPEHWQALDFTLPDCGGEAIDEIGLLIEHTGAEKFLGLLLLGDFKISGPGQTRIDPAREVEEWGAISRFSRNRGSWGLKDGRISGQTENDADLWTGNAYARDVSVSADVIAQQGESHLLSARAQGTGRFYAAGFDGQCVVIVRHDFGDTVLAQAPFAWSHGQPARMVLGVIGDRITLDVDGQRLLEARDDTFAYGMCGLRMGAPGRMSVGVFEIAET
jgi:ADP-ribosylglycohydrolase